MIIFDHEHFRFEIILAGANKKIQQQYWQIFQDSDWDKYSLPHSTKDTFAIMEHTLVSEPDFADPAALMQQIEEEAITFIQDLEAVLVQ